MKKYIAEFIAAFFLVFIGAGAIVSDQYLSAVRVTSSFGLLGIALAHGLALAVAIAAVARISGGHANPAISIAAWVARRLNGRDLLAYIAAQLLGGLAAALLIKGLLPAEAHSQVAVGAPALGPGIGWLDGMAIEVILTFFLAFTIWGVAVDDRGPRQLAPLAIGLVVVFDILAGGPFTGAAMNPARWFGPALVGGAMEYPLVWIVGPIVGALLGALVYENFFLADQPPTQDTALTSEGDLLPDDAIFGEPLVADDDMFAAEPSLMQERGEKDFAPEVVEEPEPERLDPVSPREARTGPAESPPLRPPSVDDRPEPPRTRPVPPPPPPPDKAPERPQRESFDRPARPAEREETRERPSWQRPAERPSEQDRPTERAPESPSSPVDRPAQPTSRPSGSPGERSWERPRDRGPERQPDRPSGPTDRPSSGRPPDRSTQGPPDRPSRERPSDRPSQRPPDRSGGERPSGERPTERSWERPRDRGPDRPSDRPAPERPSDRPAERPGGERPWERPRDRGPDRPSPSDRPTDRPSDRPTQRPQERPSGERPSERPSGQRPSGERPSERPSGERPSERPWERPRDRGPERPSDQPSDRPSQRPSDRPDRPSDRPTERPWERPRDRGPEDERS